MLLPLLVGLILTPPCLAKFGCSEGGEFQDITGSLGSDIQLHSNNESRLLLKWKFTKDIVEEIVFILQFERHSNTDDVLFVESQVDGIYFLNHFTYWDPDVTVLSPFYSYSTMTTFGALMIHTDHLAEGEHWGYVEVSRKYHAPARFDLLVNVSPRPVWDNSRAALPAITSAAIAAAACVFILSVNFLTRSKAPVAEHAGEEVMMTQSPFTRRSSSQNRRFERWGFYSLWIYISFVPVYLLPVYVISMKHLTQFHAGNQDSCAFNYRCMTNYGSFPQFNNMASNASLLVASLFQITLVLLRFHSERGRCARCRVKGTVDCPHFKFHLLSCIGFSCEGVMSFLYHICPQESVYQFDVAFTTSVFWIGLTALQSLIVPNSRLFTVQSVFASTGAYAIFCALEVMLTNPWYLKAAIVLFFSAVLLYQVYGPVKSHAVSNSISQPWDGAGHYRMTALLTPGIVLSPLLFLVDIDSKTWIVIALTCSVSSSLIYYFLLKYKQGEPINVRSIVYMIIAVASVIPAVALFQLSPTEKSLAPSLSKAINSECLISPLDTHDLWHSMAMVAWLFTSSALLYVDDGLKPSSKVN